MLESTRKPVSLTRAELYEQVWMTPMARLARQYGMSDVGLAKICKRYDIPRPSRGYWARKQNGQSPRRTRLPNPSDESTISLCEVAGGADAEGSQEVNDERHDVEFNVEVRDHLRGAHTLVSQANEAFAAAQANDNGLIVAPANAPLALKVSKGSLRRALLIMDALLKAFEERGYRVVAGPKVEVEGVKIGFSIEEQLESKREQPEEHDLSGSYRFGHNRFNQRWVPSGRLVLRLNEGGEYWARGCRHRWSDAKKSTLEERLSGLLPAMLDLVALKKEHEAEQKRQAEAERAKQLRLEQEAKVRAEKRKAYRVEYARFRRLVREAKNWKLSHELRAYIEAATRKHVQVHGAVEPEGEFAKWLEWADWQANRLDPFCDSPHSILDEDPKQFEEPKPNYGESWYHRQ